MTKKLQWRVAEPPTGPYRSFYKRAWPVAYLRGQMVFMLTCEDSYVPSLVREGKHAEIKINVAYHKNKVIGWDWRRLKQRAKTLSEAKEVCQKFADKFPDVFINKAGDKE
jgi:hypothetical protein